MRLSIACNYGKHSSGRQAAAGARRSPEVQRPPSTLTSRCACLPPKKECGRSGSHPPLHVQLAQAVALKHGPGYHVRRLFHRDGRAGPRLVQRLRQGPRPRLRVAHNDGGASILPAGCFSSPHHAHQAPLHAAVQPIEDLVAVQVAVRADPHPALEGRRRAGQQQAQ